MNNSTNVTAPINLKAKKQKGIIRWEAVGPFTLFVLLIWAYFFFFFDMNARHALQYFATQANGAEVDIGSLKTSFWSASLEIKKIQVTDADEPTKNKIEVGQVRWNMLWDALLRGKIAIEEASILDIQIGTHRAHPGQVLPKDPPSSQSALEKIQQRTLDNAQKQFSGNVFGDLAALLNGADPKAELANLQANLKSEARIKQLQADLKVKQKEWQDRLAKLPKDSELKALQERAKAIKPDFKDPASIQKSVSDITSLIRDADGKIQDVKTTEAALSTDLKTYQTQLQEIPNLVQSDIKDLEQHFKIPKLDAESLAGVVFGPSLVHKLDQAQFYMNKVRHYMPPKKTAAQKAEYAPPKPHERSHGRDYKFGRAHAYPMFWLKKAEISSKSTDSEFAGDLKGTLLNLTDDQPTLGLPTTLKFAGDFPKTNIHGISGALLIDHVTEKAKEALELRVAQYAVPGKTLVDSTEAHIAFAQAQAGSGFKASLEDDALNLQLDSSFDHVNYDITSKTKILEDLLQKVFAGLPRLTLNAGVTGTWQNPKFNLNTNLGPELQKGFSAQIQAKVSQAQAQIQALVNDRIGAQKAQLLSQFQTTQSSITGLLGDRQKQIEQIKSQLEQSKNQNGSGNASGALKQQGKKTLDDLKKKFGF